jgi:hypothetical protein
MIDVIIVNDEDEDFPAHFVSVALKTGFFHEVD